MEYLGRGAIAVKTNYGVFLSWRLLGSEYGKDTRFNIYKNSIKLTNLPLNNTCFEDTTNTQGIYTIKLVLNGKEQKRSDTASYMPINYIEIPLSKGNYYIQHAWPGDLDGDGEYDFVLSRLPKGEGAPIIEAYLRNGTFLWRIEMGINSYMEAPDNGANDAPPAAISGYGNIPGYRDNDNITVFDIDLDGKAEVLVRTASGVTFADGKTINSSDGLLQFISVVNGHNGSEITRTPVPGDYITDVPLSGHFGIAYLDGIRPSLVTKFKNRNGSERGNFNILIATYDFNGKKLFLRWKWLHKDEPNATGFHQLRIIDINGDGKDDICDGSYVIKNDGSFLYGIDQSVHGDRFFITDMDPEIPGLEGYGIQQEEGGIFNKFPWYYYSAATGKIIRTGLKPADVPRGSVADVDPRFMGYEMWSVEGLYNVNGTKISDKMPKVNFKIWWDGDLAGEILDKTNIYKWNYKESKLDSLFSDKGIRHTVRNAPPLYGDIFGDWREEVLWEKADGSAFRIYTTTIPTEYILYTLPHNPAYRACFTVKGYYQSNLVDYYLGEGMKNPPVPGIIPTSKQ
jgi:rhamnogalacturonan endolyase